MTYAPVPLPVPGRVLRSPVGLSHAVTALLGLVVVADLAIVAASLNMRSLMSGLATGGAVDFDESEADRADLAMAGASVLYTAALLGAAVLFIIWFHRLRQNAEIFAPDVPRRTAGWAIACWFIPVANLWIPRGIALDVLRASQPDPYGGVVRHRALLNTWWALWVWSLVFDRYATNRYDDAEDAGAIHDAAGALMAGAGFDIAAAVLAILVVRALTSAQNAKAHAGPRAG
ncbi:DUF4328 domain-containing protein [Streptomyces sp. CRN 30]|uniref:DUF4328 domain-containing protein n=1 Tax=Streptomyces sp. CRN 30 TaxID=3075613 RepID=UPI002A7F7806|nr:DUF4328 domain-containing protein [Streptomyces sp. CRN 30]